jgi:hypothetical protein
MIDLDHPQGARSAPVVPVDEAVEEPGGHEEAGQLQDGHEQRCGHVSMTPHGASVGEVLDAMTTSPDGFLTPP